MNNQIRVLIADDLKHERIGFRQILSLVNWIEVIGEVASAQAVLQKTLSLRPDVILLDMAWYGDYTAGLAAIAQIKKEAPEVRILAMTHYPDLVVPARRAGAELAVSKHALDDMSIIDRIRDVYEAGRFPMSEVALAEALTHREFEVLKLMARDKTDQQIANDLDIGVSTVKKHVSAILAKLGASSRGGAIAIGYERGLLTKGTVEM